MRKERIQDIFDGIDKREKNALSWAERANWELSRPSPFAATVRNAERLLQHAIDYRERVLRHYERIVAATQKEKDAAKKGDSFNYLK